MCVAYFAHELADPAVQKRLRMLAAGGCEVELLGFERRRFANGEPAQRRHVLGRTQSGKLVSRIFSVLLAVPRAWAVRRVWAKADAILARNLEMLVVVVFLAGLLRLKARIVYECLDLHRLMLTPSRGGRVLRMIERACLKRVSLIVTSSPAFDTYYFRAIQRYPGDLLVVENKVLALGEDAHPAAPAAAAPPWRIAWCGVLRCKRSLDILAAAAETLGDQIEIDLWGVPALNEIPDFHARVAKCPRMRFHGRYRPEDLGAVYANAHFVWAIDFYEAGGNSDWLLPNRLYEGLRFGAAPIAAAGVETARWLDARELGVVLGEPLAEMLAAFLAALKSETYAEMRAAVTRLDPEVVAFSPASCRGLAARLVGADP